MLGLALALAPACAERRDAPSSLPSLDAAVSPPARADAHTLETDASLPDAGTRPADSGPPPVAAAPRTVLEGHVENARDLGGITLGSEKRVRAGALFRGPPLTQLTADGCAAVEALGLRSLIDLRIESESAPQPDQACALQGAQLIAAPLPVPYNVSPQDYIADLDASASIARVFQVLGDEQQYPVYFHCTWGRDRTGVVAAVILLALGAGREAIMQDYLVSRNTVGAFPASLMAALDEIEARGGVEAYLNAAGVTEQQLRVLRAQAIEAGR